MHVGVAPLRFVKVDFGNSLLKIALRPRPRRRPRPRFVRFEDDDEDDGRGKTRRMCAMLPQERQTTRRGGRRP
jgi:hypothetical protein